MTPFKKSCSLFFLLFLFAHAEAQVSDEQIYKLSQVLNNVSRYYTDSINENKIVEDVIVSTLKELDPHSAYFSKDEVEEINRSLEGSFVGIGITYSLLRDSIMILSVLPDGPSQRAGLLPGDRIVKVENTNLTGNHITDKEIRKSLLGEKGTKVEVSIKRRGFKYPLNLEITRDRIAVSSIDAAYMLSEEIGYIKLTRFSANSSEDFRNALIKLKNQGAQSLIFDLRDNGGGYLNEAVDIADIFLEPDRMIVYTQGDKSPRKDYRSTGEGIFETGKVVVLIDEGTASASEIISGAIQDWDRGILVGRRSYGKGLVQRPFYLVDGSMMRLTVARYYTPGGRCIQKPYDKGFKDYSEEISIRLKHGELLHADSITFNDSLRFQTLINRRNVYGGGGIMPDIFIPMDTTLYPEYYLQWIKTGKINSFIHTYVDENREYFTNVYPNFSKYNSEFDVTEKIIKQFLRSLKINEKLPITTTSLLSYKMTVIHIKALIANDIWTSNEYWQVMNPQNEIFKKAQTIIENNGNFNLVLVQK